MGRAKEYMMELWAARPVHLEVSFLCPVCGHPAAAYADMPGDQDEFTEEVACLDPESTHEWTVNIEKTEDYYGAEVQGYPDVDVTVRLLDPGDDDDWDEPPPEPGSYGIFLDALEEWRFNVTRLGEPDGGSSRNRMLFTTLYSIVEAYLSDTIIGAALADKEVQRHMLTLDGLKGAVVSLETVLDKPYIVRDMVKTALQGMSFHNLPAVNGICRVAFKKTLLPGDADDRALVIKSVDKRHDCVHRNGKDKDGNKHVDITQDYLRKLGNIFEAMAEGLENAMQDADVERWFEEIPAEAGNKKGA